MKRLLLGSTALICLGLSAPSAFAACSTTSPTSGQTVTCAGTSTTPITANAGQNGIIVNLLDGSQLNTGSSRAIDLAGSAQINLLGNSQINADQSLDVFVVGNGSGLVLAGTSSINATGAGGGGARFDGDNSIVTLGDSASINAVGTNGDGVSLFGDNDTVTLNDNALVGAAQGHGFLIGGIGTQVTLNGHSSVISSGGNASGINFYAGSHHVLTVNDTASVSGRTDSHAVSLADNDTLVNRGTLSSEAATAVMGSNNAAATDTISNFGTIFSASGTAIDLRAGADDLILGTGSHITGTIDGGAGLDTLILTGIGSDANAFANFEILQVNGQNWSLSGTSNFATSITVQQGRLAINGSITSPVTDIQGNGILGGNGTLTSDVTSTGTIAPGNSVGTLTINGNFTQTGGTFDVEFDKSGVDRLNVLGAGGATLASNPSLNVINDGGAAGGAGIILHAPNGITGGFGSVTYQGNGAATLTQTTTDISLITVDGTPLVGSDFAASESGLDYLDSVNDEQLAGLKSCGADTCDRSADHRFHLWAKGFGRFGNEAAEAGNQSFDYRIAGTALGGDMLAADGLRLGASFGYSNTEENVAQHAANADIDTTQAALYANYQKGPYFVTGLVSGGWQHFDQTREVGVGGGNNEADSATHGWLFGSSLQAGAQFRFPKGWLLTPSAGISYQHQWVNGVTEHGGGAADVAIASHQADALRLKAQLVLSQDYQLTGYTITPHVKLGVQQQYNLGGQADGTFSDGTDFALDLVKTDRTIGLAGVGVQVAFDSGLSTYVDYDGALASGRTVQSVTGGLRYSW